MHNNFKDNLASILKAIDDMSPQEFERELISFGYYPRRKKPTKSQLDLEKQLTYNNVNKVFYDTEDIELKEASRKTILAMRRVAELMDMLNIPLD